MTDRRETEDGERGGAAGGPGPLDRADGLLARLAPGTARGRATLASLVWTVLVAAYAIGFFGASSARGTGFLDGAFFLVTWALPVILIWLAAFLAEELTRLREMVAGLAPFAAELAATREALERHPASPRPERAAAEAALAAALERLAAGQAELSTGQAELSAGQAGLSAAQAQLSAAQSGLAAGQADLAAGQAALTARQADLATGQAELAAGMGALRVALAPSAAAQKPAARPSPPPARPRPAPPAPAAQQADLPLAEPEAEPELPWAEIVRALDFPKDASDAEGFRALKAALKRPSLAQMLQAAEDVLTILSQEGVYMDDLAAAPADAEAWRRFLGGGRGLVVAGLGGVADPGALETARRLMREDTVFRDTALFFLRRFDAALREIAREADDAEIAEIADTRSGRAFQLMTRASGAFD